MLDAGVDVGADRRDALGGRERGVADRPVLVADAGVDRADVAAAHRHDDVGGADGVVGERLGEPVGAERVELRPDVGVDRGGGRRARPTGPGPRPPRSAGAGRRPAASDRRWRRRRTGPAGRWCRPRSGPGRRGAGGRTARSGRPAAHPGPTVRASAVAESRTTSRTRAASIVGYRGARSAATRSRWPSRSGIDVDRSRVDGGERAQDCADGRPGARARAGTRPTSRDART